MWNYNLNPKIVNVNIVAPYDHLYSPEC